jgi:hypothetical protein
MPLPPRVAATPSSREINNAPFGGSGFWRRGRRLHRLRRRRRSYGAASSLFNGIVPAQFLVFPWPVKWSLVFHRAAFDYRFSFPNFSFEKCAPHAGNQTGFGPVLRSLHAVIDRVVSILMVFRFPASDL